MKFDHLNRRVHLYLALFLLPWFFMYGFSSLVIHHRNMFQPAENERPEWSEPRSEPYSLTVTEHADLDAIAAAIAAERRVKGRLRAKENKPGVIEINGEDTWSQTRLVYDKGESRLSEAKKAFAFDELLVRMHVRSGFEGPLSHDIWAVLIDIVCLGFLTWIASGLYMWWRIRSTRRWGVAAIMAGFVSFGLFLMNF